MKAEHRKELETNVLADRVGRLVQTVKAGPDRRFILYTLLVVLAVVVLFIWLRARSLSRTENADRWYFFEDGSPSALRELSQLPETANTNPGRASRFQEAYRRLWFNGIKLLGVNPAEVLLQTLPDSEREYQLLAEECKNDPVWLPEALHALAVIEETKTLLDSKYLKKAQAMYEDLAAKHKDTAYGELARKRAEQLAKDKTRDEIEKVYVSLANHFNVSRRVLEFNIERSGKKGAPRGP